MLTVEAIIEVISNLNFTEFVRLPLIIVRRTNMRRVKVVSSN